jgi:hypothetical protein
LEAVMDTVLFTDQGIVVFLIALALMLSVVGLATTSRTQADIRSTK